MNLEPRILLLVAVVAIVLSIVGCSAVPERLRSIFPEPFPPLADTLPHYSHGDKAIHLGMQVDDEKGQPIRPVLLRSTNNSDSIWTLDASEVTLGSGTSGCDIAPTPVQEAARKARIGPLAQIAPIVQQMGTFATYSGALGAVTGAAGAHAKGTSIVDAVQINAAIGGAIGAVIGAIFEIFRLNFVKESTELGQINEKMTFLALRDRSTLYTGYSTSGYIYFRKRGAFHSDACSSSDESSSRITVLLTLGDPSKDWGAPSEGYTYRSPLVCECRFSISGIPLPPCSPRSTDFDFKPNGLNETAEWKCRQIEFSGWVNY